MKGNLMRLLTAALLVAAFQVIAFAQTTGSIAGTVLDANGAAVVGATVVIKGAGGQEYTVVTNDNGGYRVPSVDPGLYSVTATAANFKRSVVENVKVDTGIPSTVNVTLQAGEVSETVVVTGGGEVLQTQTATIGTTITGRQITDTPIASRDALDLVALLPGTATVGRPRSASINGLPKGSLSISIDGVDVQDNLLRSSDGYFTYVRPRVDAIEEVTVSTANPGAESAGDGAVQISFRTRRGTNDYRGGVFWQHRDESLNANYWYLNRDGARDTNGKAFRQKIRLNQYGGRYSGPIPYPAFGDGGGSWFKSGKDKAFFFVNYEEFRQPESLTRSRTVMTPATQGGEYRYQTAIPTSGVPAQCAAISAAQMECAVNVYTLATTNGQLATPDPTVAAVLNRIRTAIGTEGTLKEISGQPSFQSYTFQPTGNQKRKFLAMRFDVNFHKNHSFELVMNRQKFYPGTDFLNSVEPRYPGFPSYGQGSERNSNSFAVRSTLTRNIVNEARYATSFGDSDFFNTISAADFDYMGGRLLGVDAAGITSPVALNSKSARSTPTYDLTDNVTWISGSHSISFGGQYKIIRSLGSANNRIVPSVGFGIDSTEGTAFSMFNGTSNSMPSSTTAQQAAARALYATLIGRVLSYTTTAYLGADGKYAENGPLFRAAKQTTYGLYVQDSWRMSPSFTLNFGVRWQPQTSWIAKSVGNYSRLESFDQLYGVSGLGNIFMPGTLTGSVPRVVALNVGDAATPADYNNFAPTVGVVWSPDFGDSGFGKWLFGGTGKSVFRGGYSVSFVREGSNLLESINGANPGGSLPMSRNTGTGVGTFTLGTYLRDANNPNLTPLNVVNGNPIIGASPSFPITLGVNNSTNTFDPDLKTGMVHSFSFGYQREIDRNTVIEFRYVGNRGVDLQRQYNINEFNLIENGFGAEFLLAQQNLYANIAANRCIGGATPTPTNQCQFNFAYFGAGSGTNQLPLMMSYFLPATGLGVNNAACNTNNANNTGCYTATNFANSTLMLALSRNNPNPFAFSGTSFENSSARRANALANGRPSNFFYVNPTTPTGGSWIIDNSNKTWYDSGIIEVRRRLSSGLRVQANYVWSKAQANAYASSSVVAANFTQREGGLELAKNVQAFDITHQFKFDATYELPFGKGRTFFGNSNSWVDGFIGGWSVLPTLRWQSGSPISFGNVQLIGMTKKDLQKAIGVYKNTMLPGATREVVTFLPLDIIVNTQKAFDINVANTISNSGYGVTFGTGGPKDRFIAPAGYGNCVQLTAGKCGFNNLILYGPSFFKLDSALMKKIKLGETRDIELRLTVLDVLNMPNFRVGGWAADVVGVGLGGTTFAQMGNGSAYQDTSTTNDPGGRIVDLMIRINF